MDRLFAILNKNKNGNIIGIINKSYSNDIYNVEINGRIVKKVSAQILPGLNRTIITESTSSESAIYKNLYSNGDTVVLSSIGGDLTNLVITGKLNSMTRNFSEFSY